MGNINENLENSNKFIDKLSSRFGLFGKNETSNTKKPYKSVQPKNCNSSNKIDNSNNKIDNSSNFYDQLMDNITQIQDISKNQQTILQ